MRLNCRRLSAGASSRSNLTFEVREGIIKHLHDYDVKHPELAEYLLDQRPPLEAQLIDLNDEKLPTTPPIWTTAIEARLLKVEQIADSVDLFARH